jgi:hypothetical protein
MAKIHPAVDYLYEKGGKYVKGYPGWAGIADCGLRIENKGPKCETRNPKSTIQWADAF